MPVLRDPPHYLKPLKSTTTPKRLLWLSCRGYSTKRREHFEHHFQAAALGATWWTTRKGERRDTLDAFDAPGPLWEAVAARCPVGKRVVLFAYDLAEQMRLSQMLTHLPQSGWTLDKIVLERTASWCLLRNGKRSLMCCDLKSWCPVPWDKLAADASYGDTGGRVVLAGPNYAAGSCQVRALVISRATLQILNWIEGENLGPFRPTGGGQAFSGYRRRFHRNRILVHDDATRLVAERTAMHTGRAEAWRHGLLRDGPYVEYDLHAAYATIGRDCGVPTVARGRLDNPRPPRLQSALDRYAVLADVTVTTRVECVPYQVNGRSMWPVGTFRTMLWDPELKLALDYADKVTVHHAWLYTREPALRDFCSWVLDGLDGQAQVYGLIPQRVLKHWSRCLIGRFGLRYRAWHKFGPHAPPDVMLCDYIDATDGTKTEMLIAGNKRMLLGDLTESRESLPQIPGWVMSECRRRLWDQATTTGLNRVVYMDTDSMIIGPTEPGRVSKIVEPQLKAGWIRKGTYNRLTIYGPRNLEVGYSRRVSGLPLSAHRIAEQTFEGEVMRSVKKSMRNGELDRVVSLPRTYHLTPVDLRRQHNPDGSTSPYEIGESDVLEPVC